MTSGTEENLQKAVQGERNPIYPLYSAILFAVLSLFLNVRACYAQKLSEAQVKSAYIYNFFSYLQWQNQSGIKEYTIGFIGDEPEMYAELAKMCETKQFKGIPIKVRKVSLAGNAQNIHMLYIAASENNNIKKITHAYHASNTLIITNYCQDKTLTMINFILKSTDKIQFEINKPNITYAKLTISPNILIKGGTEMDVAGLYHTMETELQLLKSTSEQQQEVLSQLNRKLESQNKLIEQREKQISDIHLQIAGISDSSRQKSKELESKKEELSNRESEFNTLNNNIKEYNLFIDKQKQYIVEGNTQIAGKERKIEAQNQQIANQLTDIAKHEALLKQQNATIERQHYVNTIIVIVLIFVVMMLFLYFIMLLKQKRTNALISVRNNQLVTASAELKKARDAAETASKAKSIFLSNMSHELRTPLNAILGYSHMMQKDKNLDEKQVKNLATVYSSGSHLLSFINDILDFGRMEIGKPEIQKKDFNLNYLLSAVFNISLPNANEKELYLKFESFSPIPEYAHGDEKRIRQILLNLLNNAIKYTHQGGVIFRAGYVTGLPGMFRAEIIDTGEGIEADKLQEIFEAFTQVSTRKNYIEGAGLGLAITRQLVALLHGTIHVESEPGKGSLFSVDIPLPAIAGENNAILPSGSSIIGYKGRQRTILIVCDKPETLSVLSAHLESAGFAIYILPNATQVIDMPGQLTPDLILLDTMTTETNGLQTIRRIRENMPLTNTKIIGISATDSGLNHRDEFLLACDGIVNTPINSNLLFDSIKQMLDLQWETERPHNHENTKIAVNGKEKPRLPAKSITDQMVRYAKTGEFAKIEHLVTQLKDTGENPDFCKKMSGFLDNFDDDGILHFLTHKKPNT